MKKFVNDPKDFVPEMLKGIALANPKTLKYIPEYNLIMRTDIPRDDKVSIMQGSGSGHEPAHVMVVGKGMLDAACPGNVFAAPPADFVYQTTKLVASKKGVLHLLNNYTGDTMSFNMGREMAEADGVTVKTVTINDDVAVKDSTWTIGRRGVAGNFFVMKAVGAASERGASLDALETLGNRVVAVTRTMETPEGYTLTALAAIECTARALAGQHVCFVGVGLPNIAVNLAKDHLKSKKHTEVALGWPKILLSGLTIPFHCFH